MASRTVFLSRLIGLYCVLYALAALTRGQALMEAMARLIRDPAVVLCMALITVIAGLAMVLVHNVWSKCPVVVIVTLVGWLTLTKGIVFLLMPAQWLEGAIMSGPCFYSTTGAVLVVGGYLTYKGFRLKAA